VRLTFLEFSLCRFQRLDWCDNASILAHTKKQTTLSEQLFILRKLSAYSLKIGVISRKNRLKARCVVNIFWISPQIGILSGTKIVTLEPPPKKLIDRVRDAIKVKIDRGFTVTD
jgi:hypothetical protein